MILRQRFAERVAEILEAEGMTKSDLARRMGVSPSYVGDYLHLRSSPGLEVVERFAAALDVDPVSLLAPAPAAARPVRAGSG